MAKQQSGRVNQALAEPKAVVVVDQATRRSAPAINTDTGAFKTSAPVSPRLDDAAPVAVDPKDSDCLTGQLADGLMAVFKSFTGRQ